MSRYALIKDNNVENIIEADNYSDSQEISKLCGFDDAINIDLYNVDVGYSYLDGIFKDLSGNVVERQKTQEEINAELQTQNAQIILALVQGGLM